MSLPFTYLVITGASKGLGQTIAITFAKSLKSPVHFVLTGRDVGGLNNTKSFIQEERKGLPEDATVYDLHSADLSDLSNLSKVASHLFDNIRDRSYSNYIFINNAGSIGQLKFVGSNEHSVVDFENFFNLNVTSSCFLTHEYVKRHLTARKATIVNISSLCAVQPTESFSLYCSGKAARDMFHRVLATERKAGNIKGIIKIQIFI